MPAPLAPVAATGVSTVGRFALSRWAASVFGTGFTVSSTISLISGTGVWGYLFPIHKSNTPKELELFNVIPSMEIEPGEVILLDFSHSETILDLLALDNANEYLMR